MIIFILLLIFWEVFFIVAMQCSAHYTYSIDCLMDTEILGKLGYRVIVVIVKQIKSHSLADSYSLHDGYSSLHI